MTGEECYNFRFRARCEYGFAKRKTQNTKHKTRANRGRKGILERGSFDELKSSVICKGVYVDPHRTRKKRGENTHQTARENRWQDRGEEHRADPTFQEKRMDRGTNQGQDIGFLKEHACVCFAESLSQEKCHRLIRG